MNFALYVVAILGLAVLMVVHEGGHYFAARKFGMRVTKFSIGFGPTLWKHKPDKSPTTYQVAIIPFLAYVQIAGMNPYEENDPKDPGSYANASLWARTVTIAAGPLTNYFFASILIFLGVMIGGIDRSDEASMKVQTHPGGPAAMADVREGDKVIAVNGKNVANWEELKGAISSHPGEKIDFLIERDGQQMHKEITPAAKGEQNEGKILIGPISRHESVSVKDGLKIAVIEPPMVVYNSVMGIVRWATGKEKAEVSSVVGIVKETKRQAEGGPGRFFMFLGALSAYLGAFNLLPIPALDGGRLLFLGLEAASRRKPDPKFEAIVHAFGFILLLGLILFVTLTRDLHK